MRAFWKTALGELSAGRRVFVSFVVAKRKGSPGTPASRMLLLEDGRQIGTIGGGIMEQRLIEESKVRLSSGAILAPTCRVLRHSGSDLALASGLICGGEQTNVSLILEGEMDRLSVESVYAALDSDGAGLVEVSPGGFAFHPADAALDFQYRFFADEAGGWRYQLNLINQRRIAIFGGGHCGVALAGTMHGLGYGVSLIEPREPLFTLGALPESVHYVKKDFGLAAAAVGFPEKTIAVVMTYSMSTDVEALSGILHQPFGAIGLMGSALKVRQIRNRLYEMGHSELELGRVRAPIGLQFDSDTPEEIAVSIAAQILLERAEKN